MALTKEIILRAKWELFSEDEYTTFYKKNKSNLFYLKFHPEDKDIIITKREAANRTIFNGEVKRQTELTILMKQLHIL